MMRRFKPLAIVLVLAVMCSSMHVLAGEYFSDVSDQDAKMIEVLNHLGIIKGYDDATFRGEQTVTRAELTAVVCRLIGIEGADTTPQVTRFTDVPESHWASGYIETAASIDIAIGYPGGMFAPEQPVKYEEAVKILVCRLGYESNAIEEGGYPAGYMHVARRLNLSVDADGSEGTDATRLTVAYLCYNALDIPMEMLTHCAVLAYTDAGDGVNPPSARLILPDGRAVTKYFASKLKIPAIKTIEGRSTYTMTTVNCEDYLEQAVKMIGQACKYSENSDGQITSLAFSLPEETAEDGKSLTYDKGVYHSGHLATNINNATDAKIVAKNTKNKQIIANGNTYDIRGAIVINVDNDMKEWRDIKEVDINIWDVNALAYDQDLDGFTVSILDVDAAGKPAVVIILGAMGLGPCEPTNINIVKRAAVNILYAYSSYELSSMIFTLSEDCVINGEDDSDVLGVGSSFVVKERNKQNGIEEIELLTNVDFDKKTVTPTKRLFSVNNNKYDVEYIYGKITGRAGITTYIDDQITGKNISRLISSTLDIMVCDLRKPMATAVKRDQMHICEFDNKTQNGSPLDPTVGSYITLIKVYKGNVTDVVVYILPTK